jgi:hypothetical protein
MSGGSGRNDSVLVGDPDEGPGCGQLGNSDQDEPSYPGHAGDHPEPVVVARHENLAVAFLGESSGSFDKCSVRGIGPVATPGVLVDARALEQLVQAGVLARRLSGDDAVDWTSRTQDSFKAGEGPHRSSRTRADVLDVQDEYATQTCGVLGVRLVEWFPVQVVVATEPVDATPGRVCAHLGGRAARSSSAAAHQPGDGAGAEAARYRGAAFLLVLLEARVGRWPDLRSPGHDHDPAPSSALATGGLGHGLEPCVRPTGVSVPHQVGSATFACSDWSRNGPGITVSSPCLSVPTAVKRQPGNRCAGTPPLM